MNRNALNSVVFVALTTLSGCYEEYGGDKPNSNQSSRIVIELEGQTIESFTDSVPLSDQDINGFEESFGRTLPDQYRQFLLKSNGGVPSLDCIEFVEAGRTTYTDVLCFHSLGNADSLNGVEWHLHTFEGRIPIDTLPVARDSWGNLWLLATGGKEAGKVFFWDHGSYDTFDETDLKQWPLVAESFHEFLRKLQEYSTPGLTESVPSRYEIVQQANTSLSTTVSDRLQNAWHGATKEGGRFVMELVEYKVHAVFSHTDGYTRLRAVNGLIPEGEPRFPK